MNIRYRAPYHANRIAMSHEASASLSGCFCLSLSLLPASLLSLQLPNAKPTNGFPPQTVQKTGKFFHLLFNQQYNYHLLYHGTCSYCVTICCLLLTCAALLIQLFHFSVLPFFLQQSLLVAGTSIPATHATKGNVVGIRSQQGHYKTRSLEQGHFQ